jgi:hypothetical protein
MFRFILAVMLSVLTFFLLEPHAPGIYFFAGCFFAIGNTLSFMIEFQGEGSFATGWIDTVIESMEERGDGMPVTLPPEYIGPAFLFGLFFMALFSVAIWPGLALEKVLVGIFPSLKRKYL